MVKYTTNFTFTKMDEIKAYILGLMWADGWITSTKTECAIALNDKEIYKLANIFYPKQNRKIETRENSNCKILHICSKRIVSELEQFGFIPTKSKDGIPIIPNGFEKYFLLGLLDGDGCVYHKEGKNLRVFYCGNENTMTIVKSIIKNELNIDMILSKVTSNGEILLESRSLNNNGICFTLQSCGVKDSLKLLNYLYENTYGIPFLKRKYLKYKECVKIRETMDECVLCHTSIIRDSPTHKYCEDCKDLVRRLKNRQQDEYKKFGFKMELEFLLLPHDKQDIDLCALSEISSASL